jgi:hypothetical protein
VTATRKRRLATAENGRIENARELI